VTIGPGSRVGPYEVISVVGEGGMGKVWRAHHTALRRDDALKVLPEALATDPERLARLEREAQALAALNHPNVAHVYDLLDVGGTWAIVMELVEGETLAEIVRRGPLPVDEAVRLARQIALALEAAHACGITHRDLKPANVKRTAGGQVKVLDFGLAKVAGAGDERPALDSPTFTAPGMTERGVILGTAAYMSPEQARGQPVGPQADNWAFGCVLFEMLTGQTPFAGPTVTDVLAAVVRAEPDWSRLPAGAPPRLRSILRRCLQKDTGRRWHHIADVRLALEEDLDESAAPVPLPTRGATVPWTIAAVSSAIALGLAALLIRAREPAPPPSEMRVEISTPPSSDPLFISLSPDGRSIAYVADDGGLPRLWVRSLESTTARALPGTDLPTSPFWSPDSRAIGFFADGLLKRVDLDGGLVQTICRAPVGAGGAWSRDGRILFSPNAVGPLFVVASSGGTPQPASQATPGQGHRHPRFLPDDRRYLFYVQTASTDLRGVYLGSLDGSAPRRLLDADSAAVLTSSGHLLFVRQGTLFAQALDVTQGELAGEPFAIADRIAVDGTVSLAGLTASDSGAFAYRSGESRGGRQLTWFDRGGNAVGDVGQPENAALFNPDLSEDGRLVAINRTVDVNLDVWLMDVSRGVQRRFTFDAGAEQLPVFTPDGRYVIFSSDRKNIFDLYIKPVSGPGAEAVLLETAENKFPMSVSRDGRFLLYRNTEPNVNWDLWALPLAPPGTPIPITRTPFQEMIGEFSPDGRWVAYQSNESGRIEVYVQSFPESTVRAQISARGGSQPRWRRDGREVFYLGLDGRLMAVPVTVDAQGQFLSDSPVPLFLTRTAGGPVPSPQKHQYAVSADGRRFLLNRMSEDSDPPHITLVLNWTGGLRAR
jgi:serine/threonine protein kinase